jgi:hypothetical protein
LVIISKSKIIIFHRRNNYSIFESTAARIKENAATHLLLDNIGIACSRSNRFFNGYKSTTLKLVVYQIPASGNIAIVILTKIPPNILDANVFNTVRLK